jgi:hypothetical protein
LKINTGHAALAPATLAGLLFTTGCAAPQASTVPQTSTGSPASSAAISSPVPPPTATPTATASGQLPGAVSPVPGPPGVAATETFAFPDGRISFTHPAGWKVTVNPGPALDPEAQKTSYQATVYDASGAEVAHILSGTYGDGAAGPAKRTVLDHARVPGVTDNSGEATEFGFAYDEYPGSAGGPYYFMDVRHASEFLAPTGTSGTNQVILPNSVLSAAVVFGEKAFTPAFASPDAAKAWMGTEQYAQLKAMLLSLHYA